MMTPPAFRSWLKDWLARHPVNLPPASLQASYAEEVLRRVRRASVPSPARWRLPRFQIAVAFGTAFAAGLAVVVLTNRSPIRIAKEVEQSWQLLSEIGDPDPDEEFSPTTLDEDVQLDDQLVLAETEPALEDEAWIDQTVKVLNAFEAEPDVESRDAQIEEGLEELERLDEEDLASS